MADKWTPRQLDAINAKDTSVIVSAAAGSGKTSVLVEKLLRIISDEENKTPVDRIVVVTFTNDAAAQMKQRLSDALAAKIADNPENEWLCSQQALIPTAKISTIHSFCFDLIRENVQSLNISAGFKIAQPAECEAVAAKAMDNVLERFYSEQPELMDRLIMLTNDLSRSDDRLARFVREIYDFTTEIPFGEKWLDDAAGSFSHDFDPENDKLAGEYVNYLSNAVKSIAKRYNYVYSAFCAVKNNDGVPFVCDDGSSAYTLSQKLLEEAEFFGNLLNRLSDSSLDWNSRIYAEKPVYARFNKPRKNISDEAAAELDRINEIRKECKADYEKLASNLYSQEQINDDYAYNKEVFTGIFSLVKALSAEVRRLMDEKNELSFSDAEQLAVKLLCSCGDDGKITKTPLAQELSDYYRLIMIDEFQDVNNTQIRIFRMLSHGGTDDKNGDNLFTVGDLKQSIYLFRRANPKIFSDVLDGAESYCDGYKGKNAKVLLNCNFRSSGDVIDFVNFVFRLLMSKETGGCNYTSDEELVCGAEYPEADRSTELLVVDDETAAAAEKSDGGDSDDVSQLDISNEARAVALKIQSMLGVTEVRDGKGLRKCECRDFCILLRDNSRGQLYVDALRTVGISAYCEATSGYLQSREIMILINLLRTIDNPMRDIPITSVLMSPMFMLSADEMTELRMLGGRDCRIFNCVAVALADDSGASDGLKSKLADFTALFRRLRICSASQSLDRLIRTIYDSTDFLSAVQVYSDGSRKRANLRLLLEYAVGYEENSTGGLSGFLRYIDNISAGGGDFKVGNTVSPAENVVYVKTIHRSKGLEYPFVFLCGTARRFNLMDFGRPLQINYDYGLGLRVSDRNSLRSYRSFPQYVISCINRRDSVSEELRLLYVALTRAKEKLFITLLKNDRTAPKLAAAASAIAVNGGIDPYFAGKCGSMQEWIVSALLMHPEASEFAEYLMPNTDIEGELKLDSSIPRLSFSIYKGSGVMKSKSEYVKPLPDRAVTEEIKRLLAYGYDSRLSALTAKITATELAREESGGEGTLMRPDFTIDVNGLTAAEKGTAMHSFMQHCDFALAEKSVSEEADRLAQVGILTQSERNSLREDKLNSFFRSGLYARMKKSDEIMREKNFLIEISELDLDDKLKTEYNNTEGMLQGIADCIFRENGSCVIVDYKTDRVSDENVLVYRYKRQLMLYKAAFEKILGCGVKETCLYSFSLDKEIILQF